jgi:SEC-C motif-containing protein
MGTCPCCSGSQFEDCCEVYINGQHAASAVAMMRSRYTAYSLGNKAYLVETLAPECRDEDDKANEGQADNMKWVGLEIRDFSEGEEGDKKGSVEFVAKYKIGNNAGIHHERSGFRRDGDRWYCLGGEINPKPKQRTVEKIGRNEPCPCGLGKKFKKCCGAEIK